MPRTIIVGDIHGCIEEFNELLDKVKFIRLKERLILLGDLIDRGPSPVGCVRRARELECEVILGNHESNFIRWQRYEKRRLSTGEPNPMRRPHENRLAEWAEFSESDVIWIGLWPSTLRIGEKWILVHAGFEPGRSLENQRSDKILRVRFIDEKTEEMVPYKAGDSSQPKGTVLWAERWRGPESVVYGHAVHSLSDVRIHRNDEAGCICVGLDTGCVFGGKLTAMILPAEHGEPEFIQVSAKKIYHQTDI